MEIAIAKVSNITEFSATRGDLMFYFFVLIIFSFVIYAIYFILKKRKNLFPIKFAYAWIYFERTIQFGVLFILAYITGAVQPWLYEENISNLEQVNGTLEVRWGGKSNDYYIRRSDGAEIKIKFNLATLQLNEKKDFYNGKNVIVWHRKRYVYQMENDRKELIFPLESANQAVCVHNLLQVLLYLFFLTGWLVATLYSISKEKGDMNGNK